MTKTYSVTGDVRVAFHIEVEADSEEEARELVEAMRSHDLVGTAGGSACYETEVQDVQQVDVPLQTREEI